VFELVRLQAEHVTAGPVWHGEGALNVFDSPTETLSALRPARVGRGWRYSIAMTNRHNHLLRDLRRAQTEPKGTANGRE
jgi:acetoacetate decarboxylase